MIKVPLSEINELKHVCGPTELKKTGWKGGEYFDNSEWRNYPLKSSEAPLDFTHNEHIWPGGFRRLFQSLFVKIIALAKRKGKLSHFLQISFFFFCCFLSDSRPRLSSRDKNAQSWGCAAGPFWIGLMLCVFSFSLCSVFAWLLCVPLTWSQHLAKNEPLQRKDTKETG